MTTFHHEIVIIGSRCAGAATAMLLARMGHDVALIDRSTFPSDTLSTHAIARSGVVQLHRWGLLDDVLGSGAPAVRSVLFALPEADPIERTVRTAAGVDLLVAPRRHILDELLREAALAAGATAHRATAIGVTRDDSGRVSGVRLRTSSGVEHQLRARCVVGADGRQSRTAKEISAAIRHRSVSPAGTFYTYVRGLDAAGFEFHLAPDALVGVFPTHDDEACVWISTPAQRLSPVLAAGADKYAALRGLISESAPALAVRLFKAAAGGVRGAVNLSNVLRRPTGPGWALVGDAGYHRDPITGYGISDAFRDAELLARALNGWLTDTVSEDTAGLAYDGSRTTSVREIFAITRALTGFPGVARFAELQKQLSRAIEREALMLAGLPALTPQLTPEPMLAG